MTTTSRETGAPRVPSPSSLTPGAAIALSILLGLCGGYLDLVITLLGKYCWNKDGYFRKRAIFRGPCRPATLCYY